MTEPEVGDAIRLFKLHVDLRSWLIREVPGEVEFAWLGEGHDSGPTAVVVAVVDHEVRLSPDRTADQLPQPLTDQVGIRHALPHPRTRNFDAPSEADVDRFINLDQWHGSRVYEPATPRNARIRGVRGRADVR